MAELQLRLGWVIAYVDEPAVAAEFYERTFGLRSEFVAPGGSYAQMDTGATKLGFASYELSDNNFPGGLLRAPHEGPPPSMEIALVHENVDGAHALAAGCTSLAEPQDSHRASASPMCATRSTRSSRSSRRSDGGDWTRCPILATATLARESARRGKRDDD